MDNNNGFGENTNNRSVNLEKNNENSGANFGANTPYGDQGNLAQGQNQQGGYNYGAPQYQSQPQNQNQYTGQPVTPQATPQQNGYGSNGYGYGSSNPYYQQTGNSGNTGIMQSKDKGYFISGIVMGIIGFFCSGLVVLPASIISIVFALKANEDANNNNMAGHDHNIKIAKIATIVGWILLAICFVLTLVMVLIYGIAFIASYDNGGYNGYSGYYPYG